MPAKKPNPHGLTWKKAPTASDPEDQAPTLTTDLPPKTLLCARKMRKRRRRWRSTPALRQKKGLQTAKEGFMQLPAKAEILYECSYEGQIQNTGYLPKVASCFF